MMPAEVPRLHLATAIIASVAALGGILVGYSSAIIAGALDFIADEFALGAFLKGLVATSILIGGFVGAFLSGPLAEKTGLKPLLTLTSLVFITCTAGSALFSHSAAQIIAWRMTLGLAVGATTMVAPQYVAETSPDHKRGALVALIQLAITLGILASYLVDLAYTDQGNWRAMLVWGVVPGAAMLACLAFAPESPFWLLMRGRVDKAGEVYARIHNRPWTDGRLATDPSASGKQGGWAELFSAGVRPVLIIGAGLFLLQNFSGIDAILYFAPSIFKEAGFESATGRMLSTVGLGFINVMATIAALWLVDRLGRRPLLNFGAAGMAASLAMFALSSHYADLWPLMRLLSVFCLAAFIVSFAVSLGPMPYIIMSEIFPMRVRSRGMGLSSATAWGVNILVTISFLPLLAVLGAPLLFALYAGINIVTLAFCFFLVPETRGCSLDRIETNLAAGKKSRHLGDG